MGKGRAPCCDKKKVKTGAWTPAEDLRLTAYIHKHGHTNWRALPALAGLMRCGKSCRLRWINYLRPDVKRGNFTPQEELTIINLHNSFGNKWSKIASYLPGRTDNEIKNVWNTHLKKRLLPNPNPNLLQTQAIDYSTTTYSCTSSSITSAEDQNVQKALGVVDQQSNNIQAVPPPNEILPMDQDHKDNPTNSDSPTSSSLTATKDDDKIEIPVDLDVDIWQLFDSLEDEDPNLYAAANEESCINSEWFRFLEDDEVGLNVHQTLTHDQHDDDIDYFPIWPSSPLNL